MNPNAVPGANPAAAVRDRITKAMSLMAPKTVTFRYRDAEGRQSSREVEPYEIKNSILFGHCLERDAIRQFKIEAMSDVTEGRTFKPRHPIVIPIG